MNRFYVTFLSFLLLVSPGLSAVEEPWSEQDVQENVFLVGSLGFCAGFFSVFHWFECPNADFKMWFNSMAAGTCVGTLLGYYLGLQKTAPALYKKAAAYIPLTNHTKTLLVLAQDIETEGTDTFLKELGDTYHGNIVAAFNDYVQYRNDLTKALELFEVLKKHEQVTFFIELIHERITLIDAALVVIKEIPTFPYPMTLPYNCN